MNTLVIREIHGVLDAHYVSEIRNTGRKFMTHNTYEIDQTQQSKWYQETYIPGRAAGEIFAFCGFEYGDPVAYGLVQKLAGEYWLTGVIKPAAQGKGYGEELFKTLTSFVLDHLANHVMLDVRLDNVKAQALYRKLGFTAFAESNDIIVMRKVRS